jgi:hypothetical protein
VLYKCANPLCSARFLYLHQGRLFEVEIQNFERSTIDGQGQLSHRKGQVERYWLCDVCAVHISLRFDPERSAITVSPLGGCGKAIVTTIPRSASKVEAGVPRVVIRLLDLDVRENRQSNGEIRARRFLKVA